MTALVVRARSFGLAALQAVSAGFPRSEVLIATGALLIAAGAGMIFRPAGLIMLGLECAAWGIGEARFETRGRR